MVDYRYAADGRKLQEKVKEGRFLQTSRDYLGEFIYENGTLKKILFDGGYVDMIGDTPVYMFFIKDHLGSVRAVVSETGEVQQTNEFYPYGDMFGNSGTGSSGNRFRYTGKELGEETGLYDFSARFLHTSLGRFTTLDPLAEKYPSVSPYAYCNGNPVRYIDPNGMDIYVFNNGTYSHVIKEDDKHRIANITYDSKGNAKTSYYKFADPINDPSGIDSGEISQLQFVDQQTIIEMLNNQDAFNYPDIEWKQFAKMSNSTNTEYSNSFDYAASELTSRYKADVGPDNLITSPYLFISKGDTMAHNIMNYGNYLWGATGYACGINILVLAMGAHANSLGLFDLNNRNYNGYTPQFDSRDDQKSIYAGYKYARKYNFRTLLK